MCFTGVPGRKTSNDEYSMSRAASFDNRSQFSEDEVTEDGRSSRPNSTGANILYRVRREELARGGQPSVKLMAKAFEAIDEPRTDKRGFFGIRKSRSVETTQNGKHSKFVSLTKKCHQMINWTFLRKKLLTQP